jgi:hypothetical protein
MRTYEIVEFAEGNKILKRTEADGEIWWLQMQDDNPHYQEYLRYTAWVEAGNNPDEFWTQTELTEMGEE